MKTLLISLFLFTFSNADYLNTVDSNSCVYDLAPNQNSTGWCYIKRSDSLTYCDPTLLLSSLLDGYDYIASNCVLKNDLKITGLTQNQWNYLLALLAHALGFTMFFLINYIAIFIARK